MAFPHAPLPESELGSAVVKVIGPSAPPPMRLMVARGLAPLPPRDLVVGLYQLWVENEPKLAEAAAKSVGDLPPAVIHGALDDPALPAGVLDFLGRKLVRKVDLLDKLVRHRNVHDETLVGLSRVCPDQVCDTLAENQVRWLRCPAIVEGLYQNPECRMSVVHRMLEFAEREGVVVRLPNMEEIRRAMAEDGAPDPERDALFKQVARAGAERSREHQINTLFSATAGEAVDLDGVAAEPAAEEEALGDDLYAWLDRLGGDGELDLPLEADGDPENGDESGAVPPDGPAAVEVPPAVAVSFESRLVALSKMRPVEKIRLAIVGDQVDRAMLVRDSNKMVALAAIKSPKIKENEAVAFSANRTLPHEVIRYIANRRDWIKLYSVKMNLVTNPKTPMAVAMTFLGHLHAHDVRKVARSKNIPSALATAAKRKSQQAR